MWHYIESTLSSELEYVSNWLIDNKLFLHLGKTQSILFGTKRRLSTGVKLNVICNGNVIESKSNVTYLGVVILLIVIVRGGFGICFIGRLTQAQPLSSYQYHSGLATVPF